MTWTVVFAEEFEPEFDELAEPVQDEIYARAALLEKFGPRLGRPAADTLYNSKHANMKELRFDMDGGGASRLPSIRTVRRYFWSRETSLA